MSKRTQQGFTLMELIVVISIIGLLSTVVLTSLSVTRAKGRDTKRIQDLSELRTALEYYHSTTGRYPAPALNGLSENSADQTIDSMSEDLDILVTLQYLPYIPFPPSASTIPNESYYYRTANSGGTNYSCEGKSLGSGGLPYIIYFLAETDQELPSLYNNGVAITNGYCLTLK